MIKQLIFYFLTFLIVSLAQAQQNSELLDFVPDGYIVYEQIEGDLNNDGRIDCVLIIKGTDKDQIVMNRYDELVDRNRRGIIILLKENDNYTIALENYECFESENEDGGGYFPPQLSIEINEQKLKIHYAYGRYGFWNFVFQYIDENFILVQYKDSNGGAVIQSETKIDFLAKTKNTKTNINEEAKGGDEIYSESNENIELEGLYKLSEIDDFFEFRLKLMEL